MEAFSNPILNRQLNAELYLRLFLWLSALLFVLILSEGIKGIISSSNDSYECYFNYGSISNSESIFSLKNLRVNSALGSVFLFIGVLTYFVRYIFWSPWPIYMYYINRISQINYYEVSRRDILLATLYFFIEFLIIYLIALSIGVPSLVFLLILFLPLLDFFILFIPQPLIILSLIIVGIIRIITFTFSLILAIPQIFCEAIAKKKSAAKSLENARGWINGLLAIAEENLLKNKYFVNSYNNFKNFKNYYGWSNAIDILLPVLAFFLFVILHPELYLFNTEFIEGIRNLLFEMAPDIQNDFRYLLGSSLIISSIIIFFKDGYRQNNKYIKAIKILLKIIGNKHASKLVIEGSTYLYYDYMDPKLFRTYKNVYPSNPETAYMIQFSIDLIKKRNDKRIIDVGTGNGFIALNIAKAFPNNEIIATDVSNDAVENCKDNIRFYKLNNVDVLKSEYVEALSETESPDLIVANLPYGSINYLLKSNLDRDLNELPIKALFHANGLLGAYIELIEQIEKKKWKTTLLIETGVIPKDIVEKELSGRNFDYIPFENYSITQIKL